MDIEIRKAAEPDLPAVLRLYAQPGMDNGRVLALDTAAMILRRMATYPEYAVYVATTNGSVVGTFALLVMDNLAHLGTPSAIGRSTAPTRHRKSDDALCDGIRPRARMLQTRLVQQCFAGAGSYVLPVTWI